MKNLILIVLTISIGMNAASLDTNLFVSQSLGIKIRKTSSWHFANAEEIKLHLSKQMLNDTESAKQAEMNSLFQIVDIYKYHEPYDGTNPDLGISMTPLSLYPLDIRTLEVIEFLNRIVSVAKKEYPDLIVQEKAKLINIGKYRAAQILVKLNCKLKSGKKSVFTSKLIILKTNKYVCKIGGILPEYSTKREIEETEEMYKSIEIQ